MHAKKEVALYLDHQRHGVMTIVVQRTVSVLKVVPEACQVNFTAYMKCKSNGN